MQNGINAFGPHIAADKLGLSGYCQDIVMDEYTEHSDTMALVTPDRLIEILDSQCRLLAKDVSSPVTVPTGEMTPILDFAIELAKDIVTVQKYLKDHPGLKYILFT